MRKVLDTDIVNALAYGGMTLGILGGIAGLFWLIGLATGGN